MKFLFCFQNTWTDTQKQINWQGTPVQLLILGKLLKNQEINQALKNQIIQRGACTYCIPPFPMWKPNPFVVICRDS